MRIELTDEAQRVMAQMRTLPERVAHAIAAALDRENELTVGHIQKTRLSQHGPSTLGVRTGRLRRSVRPARAQISGERVVSSIGSNVVYLGPHEFGMDEQVAVKSHRRKVASRDVFRVGPRGGRRRVASRVGFVRSHRRHMRVRARAPLQMGIEDRLNAYSTALSEAALQAAEGGA